MKNIPWGPSALGTTTALLVLVGCASSAPTEPSDAAEVAPAAVPASEYPLRREDPRAQLPRELLDVQAERLPQTEAAAAAPRAHAEGQGVRFTVATGEVEASSTPPPVPAEDHTPSSFGVLGDDAVSPGTAGEPGVGRIRQGLAAGDTLAWPARAMVKLFVTHADGSTGACSGTMVGPRAVLTAGHCIYERGACNANTGICQPDLGWQRAIRAVPALDGTYMPFGSANMTVAFASTDWVNQGTGDYGVVILDRELGKATGYESIYAPANTDITGYSHRIQGISRR